MNNLGEAARQALAESDHELAAADEVLRRAERRRAGERRATEKVACPLCGHLRSLVVPYHMTVEDQQTGCYIRRRACSACGAVYETSESVGRIIQAPTEILDLRNI